MRSNARRLALLLACLPLAGCDSCRKTPPDTGDTGDVFLESGALSFGLVPTGTAASRTLAVTTVDGAPPTVGGVPEGLLLTELFGPQGGVHRLVFTCQPEILAGSSGEIVLSAQTPSSPEAAPLAVAWDCASGDRTPTLPSPALVSIGTETLSMHPDSGLGQAEIGLGETARLFQSPATGDTFLTDPEAGRVWRQNAWYLVPAWGAWVAENMARQSPWDPIPDCFDGTWTYQHGGCTGLERNADGSIPDGFYYYHGGFIGESDRNLLGVRTGVALPDVELLALAGERAGAGFVAVVDAGIVDRLADEYAYSYMKLVRPVAGEFPVGIELAYGGSSAWVLDPAVGTIWSLTDLDTTRPTAEETTFEAGEVRRTGVSREGLVLWGDGGLQLLDARGLTPLPAAEAWGPLAEAEPDLLAGDGTLIWAWYATPGLLAWRDEAGDEAGLLALPDVVLVRDLAADRMEGGTAETSAVAWLAVDLATGPALIAAQAGTDLGETAGLALPATPLDLSVDPWPHDVFVAYPQGPEGCDGELAEWCVAGTHPALLSSYYAPYGLVPPTSTGHRLNLFMNPILETPKDEQVNIDFSKGNANCGDPPEGYEPDLWSACCAMEWSNDERVRVNLDYFLDTWGPLGSDTPEPEDDVSIVLGVNPSWLWQAWNCYLGKGEERDRGFDVFQTLADYRDQGVTFTNWTHTSMADANPNEAITWFTSIVPGADPFEPPMDSQDEYERLHEGLAAVWDLSPLGTWDGPDGPVAMADLTLPFITGAGNSFDGGVMLDPVDGWPDDDPSWVRAVRDGPVATRGDPLRAYYFASAGGMPEVDLEGYRKKELFPLDMRRRAAAFPMGEHPEDWYTTSDADMIYFPGSNWEVGTIFDVARSGLYRESLSWGVQVSEDNWEMIHRYLRRITASAQADDVKSWYLHIYDISNPNGNYQLNSNVQPGRDVNVDALERINEELVRTGYARWSNLDEMVAEWDAANP